MSKRERDIYVERERESPREDGSLLSPSANDADEYGDEDDSD